MYREFFTRSPVLALPVLAMFLFLAVFVAVVLVTWRRPAGPVARDAALPLDDAEESLS